MSYTEQLIAWGDSGAFFPNLIPDDRTQTQLRTTQDQIRVLSPNSKPVDALHMSLFYLNPSGLYDYMVAEVNPGLRKERLYLDLASSFGAIALCKKPFNLPVSGIEAFGADGSMAALKLERTHDFGIWLEQVRELSVRAITLSGATQTDLAKMSTMPEYQWTLGESSSHISLVKGMGLADVRGISFPESVRFSGFSDGSARRLGKSAAEMMRWYILPGFDNNDD